MKHKTFGQYDLIRKLASGGMAEVWLAKPTGTEDRPPLVLKRILPHLAQEDEFLRMFLNEARIATRFQHPNIGEVYEAGEADGTYYMAMEYLHGEDLSRVMRRAWSSGQWIHPAIALRIAADCCEALAYAHDATDDRGKPMKVVHRDVSPPNVLVCYDGAVKLVDFGIAKATDPLVMTQAGAIKGKFAYMSPEQAMGGEVDRRSDVYSLALVLYELLTGVRPLKREGDAATHQAAVEAVIDPPSQSADLPPEIDALLVKALERLPENRFQSALELRDAIEALLEAKGWMASGEQLAKLMASLFGDAEGEEGAPDANGLEVEEHSSYAGADEATGSVALPFDADVDDSEQQGSLVPAEPGLEHSASVDIYGEDDPLPVDELDEDDAYQADSAAEGRSTWEGPLRRLDVVEGPDEGEGFVLDRERLIIGRVQDCHIALADRSVSRRHLELLQTETAVLLRDLGSGNGTEVNGELVTEQAIQHGDEIAIGATRFRLFDEEVAQRLAREAEVSGVQAAPVEGAPDADEDAEPSVTGAEEGTVAEEPPPPAAELTGPWARLSAGKRRITLTVGGVVALLVVAGAWSLANDSEAARRQIVEEKLKRVELAIDEDRLQEAATLLGEVIHLAPAAPPPGLARSLGDEIRSRSAVITAAQLRREGELEEARDRIVRDVHGAWPATAHHAVELLFDLELRLAIHQKIRVVLTALANGELEQARQLARVLPPQQREALEARIDAVAEQRNVMQARARKRPTSRGRVRTAATRQADVGAAFREVDRKIVLGDYKRALLALDRIEEDKGDDPRIRQRAEKLRRTLPSFVRSYEDAQKKYRAGSLVSAYRPLKRARELYLELGVSGGLEARLTDQLVESALASASASIRSDDLESAKGFYRSALQAAPGHGGAQAALQQLEERMRLEGR